MPETGVDQIINRIPGIWTYTIPTGQLHPTGQPVSIRGFGTSTTINTLVMVDGVPINDPYLPHRRLEPSPEEHHRARSR